MSDEEYEYQYDSNEEYDYGSDQSEVCDDAIEVENAYYEGGDHVQDNPDRAIELFEKVVDLEKAKQGEFKWTFSSLQQLVTLHFKKNELERMVTRYQEMLAHIGDVTRNESTEAINSVLETLSASTNWATLSTVYEITLNALRHQNNERLWFNTNLKLARACLESQSYSRVESILSELKSSFQRADGSDDVSKGSLLLDVYALEIQLCSARHDTVRMKEIYPKTLNLNAVVADPRVMGIIREEGGCMYMSNSQWTEAYNEFYEAFRAHQEAGNARAKACLKYMVLANMLALSDINPFAAREAKVYQDDREIVAMMDLRMAYDSNDLDRFERTLNNKSNHITDDTFMMTYIAPLRRRMCEQVLLAITRPYQKVTLAFLAKELNLTVDEVESLLVDMILEERLTGRIHQIEGYLQLGGERSSPMSRKLTSIAKWATTLESLTLSLSGKLL